MGGEIDVPGTVSDSLHTVIAHELNQAAGARPPTLGSVLYAMNGGLVGRLIDAGEIPKEDDYTIFEEIRTLIERHGADVLAQDFMRYRASDNLATVIQYELDKREGNQPPTLGSVLEAMNGGALTQLIATGDIDPDEDDTLFAEIQWMIDRYGSDTPAEEFLP